MADLRMPDINLVILAGRLTRDAELQYAGGVPVCDLGLAVSRKYKTKDGDTREETLFVQVKCWRGIAEWAGKLKKGEPVYVAGRLAHEEWTDRDGHKRSKTRVIADRIQGLAWPDQDGQRDTREGGEIPF